ncbi:MAG: transport system ATP-binding/permease protein, partial [Mycobacterium sp.]|nr:transport system ATP-binding/permease protein [Mycobacterium sp.]
MRSRLEHRSGQAVDRLIQMSRPLPPNITVSSGDWQRTFAPGNDVVIGRDVRADVRVAHLGVSRLHVVLRYLDGQWVAIDNQSLNGIFVDGRR